MAPNLRPTRAHIFDVRCGSIKASSGHSYLPMPCPVREGQPFYVDKTAVVITHLPVALVEGRPSDEGIGSSARAGVKTGGGAGVLLSGIMTNSKDRGSSGVRAFLTFTLDRPAVVRDVYVCTKAFVLVSVSTWQLQRVDMSAPFSSSSLSRPIFWTSRGHRCRLFPPPPKFYVRMFLSCRGFSIPAARRFAWILCTAVPR